MFKTIQISLTGHDGDKRALETGFGLAKMFDAHADCLHVRFDPIVVAMRTAAFDVPGIDMSKPYLDALAREGKRLVASARASFDEAALSHAIQANGADDAKGASATWQELTGDEFEATVMGARYHDLLVVDRTAEFDRDDVGSVILACGRPVLLPPSAGGRLHAATIAIAWKETAEAARAVTAAMPLLERAQRVVVIAADDRGNEAASVLASAERLAASLRWHGIKSEGRLVVPGERDTAEAVFAEAIGLGAQLLVMGGYGRSRAREMIFGGFTRRVLKAAPLPVLLLH